MKIIIDMNLPPSWSKVLQDSGHQAMHWSEVGKPHAPDSEILTWAKANGFIVFTHDLDFGALLAINQSTGPSVLQVRAQDTLPASMGNIAVSALNQFQEQLLSGALVTVEPHRHRARVLPLR